MNYNVIWMRSAEAQLAALWLRSADRQAIADAAEAADRILRRDPGSQGESREPGSRLWFYRPLAVLYLVDDAAQTVYVAGIKWVGR